MEYFHLFAAFLISLAATLLAVPPVKQLAMTKGWVDAPDGERKMHTGAIVCVGGIAMLVGLVVGYIYVLSIENLLPFDILVPGLALVVAGGAMFSMGLVDDILDLSFRKKFIVQIAAAIVLVVGGYRFEASSVLLPSADPALTWLIDVPITLFWIVGIINATNLVDGLDGLAAGLTLIAVASFALVYGIGGYVSLVILALPLAGALAGFLVHNFNPATMFMGNSGSYLLGVLLAGYSIQAPVHANSLVALMIVLVILGLPVLDTTYSILRRVVKGRSPFSPDCDHVHHRLVKRFSHRSSVLILYGVALGFGLTGVVMAKASLVLSVTLFASIAIAGLLSIRLLGYVPRAASARSARNRRGRNVDSAGDDLSPSIRRRVRHLEMLETP